MSGERTERATPRRLAELRSKGSFPRSPELGSAIGLLVGLVIVQSAASTAGGRLQGMFTGSLADMASVRQQGDLLWAGHVLGGVGGAWLTTVAPLMAVLPLVGVGLGFAQGGLHLNLSSLWRGASSLNPIGGFKRLLSPQSGVTLLRSLLKLAVVAGMAWRGYGEALDRLAQVQGSADPRLLAAVLAQSIMGIAMPAAETLVALAVADYAYQRWSFLRGSRMSRQEVKDESRQAEGDPLIKGRMRAQQRRMALARRQLKDVPGATVVVTNPTHIAVALKYERGMPSPRVVALGADLIAERIKQVAREAGVPLVENKPLARGLFATAEVGDEIPVELYQAVAEVLAYVYGLRRRRARP